MNIYLISWADGNDYDKFDSAVVIAPNEETARNMAPQHTCERLEAVRGGECEMVDWSRQRRKVCSAWAKFPSDVNVRYLGAAHQLHTECVCASFNAG